MISAADQSVFRGPANANIKRLKACGLLENVELVFEKNWPRNTVKLIS
jgi:hypothetical protein